MSKKKHTLLLQIIIISLAISPAIALGEGDKNFLLIIVMCVFPFIILYRIQFYRSDIVLGLFMFSIILFPLIFHYEAIRWSTIIYSLMFCSLFFSYKLLMRGNHFTLRNYQKTLKYLIYAYSLVLIIQQFCVLTGLPIFNINNYDPSNIWKLNSLSAEPSHTARIISLLFYSYIIITEILYKSKYKLKSFYKKDIGIWLSFIWVMISIGSSTVFIFFPLILYKVINFKSFMSYFFTAIMIITFSFLQLKNSLRAINFLLATISLNEETIIVADHSASIRILPTIILSKMVTVTTLDGLFGHGVDFVSSFMGDMIPGVNEGFTGGGLLAIWMEYGFISFILFVIFSLQKTYNKMDYTSIIFWFMLVFLYWINSQISWLCITLLFTNKYFLKLSKRGSI